MSAGWGRFQDEGAGPDWLAGADAAPEWAAAAEKQASEPKTGDDERPSWAVPAEAEASERPQGWASIVEPAKSEAEAARPRSAGRESGSRKPDARGAARKKTESGWSSRRRDRDPTDERPKPPPSREKLEQRAKNILLYHLGRQMQTRSQLAERLRKKEIPADIAEAVLDRFEELHLLDDATYAETFVRSRHNERGLAKRALGYELRRRGIDDDTAAEALQTLDEDQEAATARRLVDSRLRATRGLDPQVRFRRLVGMLARKGYSSSVAMRAVKEALAAEGEEYEPDTDTVGWD